MQSPALIQRTQRLVEQADQALLRTPASHVLASLMHQLDALQRLLAGYGLPLPGGGPGARRIVSGLEAEAHWTAAGAAPSPVSFPSWGGVRGSESSVAAPSGGLPEERVEEHRRPGQTPDSEQPALAWGRLHSETPPLAASTGPAPLPEQPALDAAALVGNDAYSASLPVREAPAARRAAAEHPPRRRATLPVANITQVKTPAAAAQRLPGADAVAAATEDSPPFNPPQTGEDTGGVQRRVMVQPGVAPAPAAANHSWPAGGTVDGGQLSAYHPDNPPPRLSIRRLPTAATPHARLRQQGLELVGRASPWPVRAAQPPSGADPLALQRADAGPLYEDGSERQPGDGPEDATGFAAPDEDLQKLAEQLERLLRDEARRHGIEL
jgi:hypothetical protein